MAEYYDYITGQGVIVPDTSMVLEEVQNEFRQVFGDDLDITTTTVQGRLIEMFQRNRTFCINICALVSNMLNLNRASGFVLDDLGSLFLIERRPASYTTTTVILSGSNGTIVPVGTRLQTIDGDIFVNDSVYTINESGSVVAQFRADKTGVVPCEADSLNIILDNINGLESVINPSAPTLGQDLESDTEFRLRIKNSLDINSIAILSAIKSNLEGLKGVEDSYCYDNFTSGVETVDGVKIPAHSILVCVDGGNEDEIAKVIYEKKTIGTGYIKKSDNTSFDVVEKIVIDEAYGTEYKTTFIRPVKEDIKVAVEVRRQKYSGIDLEEAVKDAIIQWYNGGVDGVDGIKIGKSVSPFEISAAISDVIPELFVSDVKVARLNATLEAQTLTFGVVHKASISKENITVVVK